MSVALPATKGADRSAVVFRLLGAADAPLLQDFVRGLSPASRRLRFQSGLIELYPELLARLVEVDCCERVAFAALIREQGKEVMVGEARYAPAVEAGESSEFALAVADAWQHRGIGAALMEKLLSHARRSGISRVHGDILRDNAGMLRLARTLGFESLRHPDSGWLVRVALDLRPAPLQPVAAAFGRLETAGSNPAPTSA
jgi:GNAT superfamily N-acetyltransferase